MNAVFRLAFIITVVSQVPQDRWIPSEQWFRETRSVKRPKTDFVTKRETAVAIGRAVIEEHYGKVVVEGAEPYDAKRFGDTWVVYGYLPTYLRGGTSIAEISAKTGAVVKLFTEQ